jgi:CrcB protein
MPNSKLFWKQSGLVALGAVLGVFAREAIHSIQFSPNFYGATSLLFINVLGASLLGLVLSLGKNWMHFEDSWRPFLTTGVLGGFTTTSAFAVTALALNEYDSITHSLLYVFTSVGLAALGFKLTYELAARK